MHFLLSSMSMVYVLTTHMPEDGGDNPTVEQVRKRAKWDNDDYVCRGLILNEHNNKGKRKHHDNTRVDPNKKAIPTCWKCGKNGHIKRDCKSVNVCNKANRSGTKGLVDDSSNSLKGATVHVCKDRCYFKTYESLNDGSILHMGNESTALVHGRGYVDLRLNIVNDNIGPAFMSTSKLNDSILWHARLGHVHFKRMQDMSKDGLIPTFDMDTGKYKTCILTKITKKVFQNVKSETEVLELIHSDLCDLHATPLLENKKYFVTFIDNASKFCYVYLLHTKDEALDIFKSVGIIHEMTAPYTQQQNGISERKNRVLSQGFWGEAMLTTCYLLNRVPNKRNRITLYKLWTKRKPNLNYLKDWDCKAVIRLPDPKLKTLGERGIDCIFIGYAEHSKAFRFYVIKPNDSVSINSIIESRDTTFDENRFSSVSRPSLRILNGTKDIGVSVVPKEVTKEVVKQPEPELRKSKRNRTPKEFGYEFQLYLIERTRDEVSDQHSYCFNIEDLPPGCKTLGFKWIFKRKLKVDGTIEMFKASTIRLLIALASIYNLIIHQMDVKTAFLNGELDEEIYMNQPQGFILPGNENMADKYVYRKFDESGRGVIIFLYVDDILIFGTNQVQVDLVREFLSQRFSMKDIEEDDVIFGIRIKHESNGIVISQSHYIEKVLKKFNYFYCSPVRTPIDTSEKLMPNNGHIVSQLEYSRVIEYLMYAMTCTRSDIAFAVGKLSKYTSNPGYPSVLEGYTVASWISNTEDNSSTSGWVFLLGAAAGKEAEWLKTLLFEIPL
ncbi:zinc finger, CCHC-type containing protein [Tanacetum coccineum]